MLSARWPDAEADSVRSYLDEEAQQLGDRTDTLMILDRDTRARSRWHRPSRELSSSWRPVASGAVGSAVLGSVADEVIRTACGPILLIGPHVDPQWRVPHQGSVVVGTDGSLDTRHAAEAAGVLAESIGAAVEILELLELRDTGSADLERRFAATRLRALAMQLRSRGVDASFELVDGFRVSEELLERVRTRGHCVLAVGSHGRSGLLRAAFGSVTLRVVEDAACPVLVAGPRWRAG